MNNKKRLLIIPAANNMNFLADIAKALEEKFEIDVFDSTKEQNIPNNRQYSYIWLEWADGYPLYMATKFTKEKLCGTKVILRIHRYELFQKRTLSLIAEINPNIIDKLLFVSEYVKQIGISMFPWMERGEVIPNLIDHTKFPFHDRKRGKNILFLGRISYVKNLPFLMQLFYELLKFDPYYKLHIVGDIADKELYYFKENFIKKIPYLNIGENIIFHGRIENSQLPDIMNEIHYIVCTSIFESQGVGILEAMATGIKPIVYNFGGAEDIFPDKYLFMTRSEFLENIMQNSYNPREYHDFVIKNFSIKENLGLYIKAIEGR